jgi:Immunoglobulin I-set domain
LSTGSLNQFQNDAPAKLQNFRDSMEAHSQVSGDADTNADEYYDERNGNEDDEMSETDRPEYTNQNGRGNGAEDNPYPHFTKPDQLNKLIAKPSGNMVHLKCNAAGNPKPNITWTKNGEVIMRSMGQVSYKKYAIVLEDLVPKDSGAYDCKVCNKLGCINYTTKLEVLGEFCYL